MPIKNRPIRKRGQSREQSHTIKRTEMQMKLANLRRQLACARELITDQERTKTAQAQFIAERQAITFPLLVTTESEGGETD